MIMYSLVSSHAAAFMLSINIARRYSWQVFKQCAP